MRGYDKGSVISFVLVGVVLILATVGVLYGVRQYTSTSSTVVEPEASLPTNDTAAKDDKTNASDTSKSSDETASSSQNNTTKGSGGTSKTQTPTATQIPQTGPTETIGTVVVAGLLAGTAVAYIRSRRQVSSL